MGSKQLAKKLKIFCRCQRWITMNRTYDFWTRNCQKFAAELILWLTDGAAKLPPIEAAALNMFNGPAAFGVSGDGESKVDITKI